MPQLREHECGDRLEGTSGVLSLVVVDRHPSILALVDKTVRRLRSYLEGPQAVMSARSTYRYFSAFKLFSAVNRQPHVSVRYGIICVRWPRYPVRKERYRMSITPTELRKNIYRLLDEVIETGRPIVVERRGRRVRISVEPGDERRVEGLPRHDCIDGDPDDLVHMDWSHLWEGGDSLE